MGPRLREGFRPIIVSYYNIWDDKAGGEREARLAKKQKQKQALMRAAAAMPTSMLVIPLIATARPCHSRRRCVTDGTPTGTAVQWHTNNDFFLCTSPEKTSMSDDDAVLEDLVKTLGRQIASTGWVEAELARKKAAGEPLIKILRVGEEITAGGGGSSGGSGGSSGGSGGSSGGVGAEASTSAGAAGTVNENVSASAAAAAAGAPPPQAASAGAT